MKIDLPIPFPKYAFMINELKDGDMFVPLETKTPYIKTQALGLDKFCTFNCVNLETGMLCSLNPGMYVMLFDEQFAPRRSK